MRRSSQRTCPLMATSTSASANLRAGTTVMLLCGLMMLPRGGDAFIAPKVALGALRVAADCRRIRPQPEGSTGDFHMRAVSGVSMATGELNDRGSEGEEVTRHVLNPGNKVSAAARGSLRRLRSLFGRKAATAAAVSAVVSAAASGPASALGWGKGKVPEVPDVPSIERQVEQLAAAAEAVEDGVEQLWESAGEAGQAVSGAVEEVEGVVQEGIDDVVASLGLDDGEDGMEGVGALQETESAETVGAFDSFKAVIAERPKLAAAAILGAAGATVVVSSSGGSGKRGRRRAGSSRDSTASRAGGYAPASKYAGIGQPRVAPEVAAARAKEQEDSLKRANFDVDLELFGDAGIDMPSRPPPPAPPGPEPLISPSQASNAIQEAFAAREARAAAGTSVPDPHRAEPTAVTPEPEKPAAATGDRVQGTSGTGLQAVAEPQPANSVEDPVVKKQEKKRRAPLLNIFNKDKGPQRATTIDEALSGDSNNEAVFRQATAAVLSRAAPRGVFDVPEPQALYDAVVHPEDFEGEAGRRLAESSRVDAVTQLAEVAGFSTKETAEVIADIVNAMVVRLVDSVIDGVGSKDDAGTAAAVDALLSYMDGAGTLFAAVCPGVELDPPIRYNGSARKGKLEKVFEAAARTALKSGDEGRMGELDRLQDMFSIKEGKANSITQKIMMDLMMKMMSDGGASEETAGFEKMMKAMGGGMPGMGANRTPEEHKKEVEALRAMVDSGQVPVEEVEALRKMYTDAGMDLDQLVTDPSMEAAMDSDAKEVVGLLRKLLASAPKK